MIEGKTYKGRTYKRKFDYGEARQRYAAGELMSDLAHEYGVSPARVRQVVNPEVGRKVAERAAAQRWTCPQCGAQTRKKGSLCRTCWARSIATSVQENALHCVTCKEWKPDDAFPFSSHEPHRRGRHTSCRSCNTINRRAHRQRNREADNAYQREYKRKRRAEARAA